MNNSVETAVLSALLLVSPLLSARLAAGSNGLSTGGAGILSGTDYETAPAQGTATGSSGATRTGSAAQAQTGSPATLNVAAAQTAASAAQACSAEAVNAAVNECREWTKSTKSACYVLDSAGKRLHYSLGFGPAKRITLPCGSAAGTGAKESGADAGVAQVGCPSTAYVIDLWPYTTSGGTWIRPWEASGLAMQLNYLQIHNITSGRGFRMLGEAGGGSARLSLCPGDITGAFPAAVFLKSGKPCLDTANSVYFEEETARAAWEKRTKIYGPSAAQKDNGICVIKPAAKYYMNVRPTNRTGSPQWHIMAQF
ncbi:MAG: hypothetical protein NDI60_02880 [Elusimicrobiales bacterium]|nr:hypothetical protein [Elusimicrobiales bacterium]